MIAQVGQVYGKLFQGVGFPGKVDSEKGLTFEGFMRKVKKMHDMTIGMSPSEAKGMFHLIDGYVAEGYKVAAAAAKNTIYGASPADKALGAWMPADEPLMVKIGDTLRELKKLREHRKALPGVMAQTVQARTLPGFDRGSKADAAPGTANGRSSPPSKRAKKGGRLESAEQRAPHVIGNKEQRNQNNPKRVFYYDDGTYSIMRRKVDWPKICEKFGWDQNALCGPVTMTFTVPRNRDHNCMDTNHRYATLPGHEHTGTNHTQKGANSHAWVLTRTRNGGEPTRPKR